MHPCHHPDSTPSPSTALGDKTSSFCSPGGLQEDGGSCGHGQKVMEGDVGGLRNHSTALVPVQASPHYPHLEGICRAPPLPSLQRIQIEPFGSFFLLFSSLLPAGADLSLQLAELHPRGTCFAFVVHEIAINYWLLCVSQSPTQPIKLSGHDIALCTRLLLVSWHRPKGRVGAPGMCCSPV